jgi:TIR domain
VTVFVSYSSRDRDAVKSLVQDLQDADEQVWMDQRLAGGEAWWRAILEQIRGCDVFIFALSQNSIESKPCQAELQYAQALGLPILPVQVGPVDSMSLNPLATVQTIDYRHSTPNTGMRMLAALNRERARRQPLPEPPPPEPPVPFEYLIRLYTTISSPDYLTPRDQAALVAQLQVGLGEDGQHDAVRNDIVMLLTKLRDREDVTYQTRTDCEAILASLGAEAPASSPAPRAAGERTAEQRDRVGSSSQPGAAPERQAQAEAVSDSRGPWPVGLLEQLAPPRASRGDDVDVSVFSPSGVVKNESFLVQVLAHLPEHADEAGGAAEAADPDTGLRGVRSLAVPIALNTPLVIELSLPGLKVDQVAQELRWTGRTEGVQFEARVPKRFNRRSVTATVTVSRSGIPIGHLKWKIAVEAGPDPGTGRLAAQGQDVARYRQAFISYASHDRPEVLRRVQLLRALGVGYFQDVLDLEPGERWKRELYRQIELCDLFLLFWSREAKRSKWVRREVKTALRLVQSRGELGGPALRPVLIEGPPVPKPWRELDELHFNDRLLYLMH